MKPLRQTLPGGPNVAPELRGDCFRACIASIMEVGHEDLPNPHDADHWFDAWQEALEPWGLRLIEWDVSEDPELFFPGYWIASVPSKNLGANDDGSPVLHCVVMHGADLAHDPSMKERYERIDLADVRWATIFHAADPAALNRWFVDTAVQEAAA